MEEEAENSPPSLNEGRRSRSDSQLSNLDAAAANEIARKEAMKGLMEGKEGLENVKSFFEECSRTSFAESLSPAGRPMRPDTPTEDLAMLPEPARRPLAMEHNFASGAPSGARTQAAVWSGSKKSRSMDNVRDAILNKNLNKSQGGDLTPRQKDSKMHTNRAREKVKKERQTSTRLARSASHKSIPADGYQEGSDFPGLTHISESSKNKTRPVFFISGEEAQKRKDRMQLLDTAKQRRQEQGRATRQPRYVKPEWFKKEFQESPGMLDRLRKSGFKPDINFWLQLRAVHRGWGVDDEKNWMTRKTDDEALKALGDRIETFQCSQDVDRGVMELVEAEARKVAELLADVDEANELISKRRLLDPRELKFQMSQIPELDDQKQRLCLLKAWHAAAREWLAAAQWLERQKNLLLLRQLSILVQQNPDDPEHGPYVNRNRSNLLAQSFTTLLNRVGDMLLIRIHSKVKKYVGVLRENHLRELDEVDVGMNLPDIGLRVDELERMPLEILKKVIAEFRRDVPLQPGQDSASLRWKFDEHLELLAAAREVLLDAEEKAILEEETKLLVALKAIHVLPLAPLTRMDSKSTLLRSSATLDNGTGHDTTSAAAGSRQSVGKKTVDQIEEELLYKLKQMYLAEKQERRNDAPRESWRLEQMSQRLDRIKVAGAYEAEIKDWIKVMSLGGGAIGDVVLIQTRRSMKTFALKELKRKEKPEKIKQEVDAMRGFEHDCVLPLIDANVEQNFIIVEYCSGGSLQVHIESYKTHAGSGAMDSGMPLDLVRTYTQQLASAVDYIHREQVVHCDIKNVMIQISNQNRYQCKLGDFGEACRGDLKNFKGAWVGTFGYQAPEVYLIARRRELNDLEKWAKEEFENMKKADIWSLAVVVLAMKSGETRMHAIFFDLVKTYVKKYVDDRVINIDGSSIFFSLNNWRKDASKSDQDRDRCVNSLNPLFEPRFQIYKEKFPDLYDLLENSSTPSLNDRLSAGGMMNHKFLKTKL